MLVARSSSGGNLELYSATGTIREYFNALGNAAPAITDIEAFAACPTDSEM